MQKGIILSILFLSLLLFKNNTTLAQTEIEQKNLTLKDQKFFKDGALYSGFMIVKFESGQTKQKIEVKDGVPNGVLIQYYVDNSYNPNIKFSQVVYDSLVNIQNAVIANYQKLTSDSAEYQKKLNTFYDYYGGIKYFEHFKTKRQNNEMKKKDAKQFDIKLQELADLESKISDNRNDIKNQMFVIMKAQQNVFLEDKKRKVNYQKEFEYEQLNLVKNGSFKSFYENGSLREESFYTNGLRSGQSTYYQISEPNKKGYILNIGNYSNDKKNGNWKFYYSENVLKSEGIFVNDLKSGIWTNYFEKRNVIESKGEYKIINSKEVKTGNWDYFNNKSQITKSESYDLSGKRLTYIEYSYKKDKLDQEVKYNNEGVKNGNFISYYINGNKLSEGKYLNNLMEGTWSFYYENGKLKGMGNFLHGDGSDIGDTGIPRNNRDGNWKTYTEEGVLSQSSVWDKGTCNNRISYFPNGVKQEEIKWVKQIKIPIPGPVVGTYLALEKVVNQYLITTWNQNSIKIVEYNRINSFDGEIHGNYKEYDAYGKLSKEFTYSYGNKEGEFKIYESGILTMKGNICASCEDESKLIGDLYTYENQKVKSHHFIEKNGTWYDRLNPNNPPENPKEDLTERFKTSLPASFTVTQDGVSFLMRLEKNGTGMIMMGQYGPDNLLWSIKNGDQLSVYNTAFKASTTYKITYSSKTSQNPVLEENSKGKVYYWNVKN